MTYLFAGLSMGNATLARSPEQQAARHGIDLGYELQRGFAGRLIRRKARQLVGKARLTLGDRDDVEQDLRIALLERLDRFNPRRSHWRAFVLAVIDRQVATLLEARGSQKRQHRKKLFSLTNSVQGEEEFLTELGDTLLPRHQDFLVGVILNDHQSLFALEDDLAAVLARLPAELQELCQRRRTQTVTQIARELKVPRSTVAYWFSKIAKVMAEADLEKYLTGDS